MAQRFVSPVLLITILLACGDHRSTQKSDPEVIKESNEKKPQPSISDQNKKQETDLAAGKRTYQKYCLACHQTDGSGVPGLYPPLQNTDWVTENKERLISIVINGLQGEIVVNGETYNNVMPGNPYLSDQEIANVLSYIRVNFENNAGPVTPAEVRAVRQQSVKPVQ
ncbi:MAG: c-type cytochrome [Bacteroidetes bacterium]|nr:c-type cytochrome [Bacteroidota bacterium]